MRKWMVLSSQRNQNYGRHDECEDVKVNDVTIGCGSSPADADESFKLAGAAATLLTKRSRRRRRLQTVNDPSQCNNVTNFFCWMSCREIPKAEEAASYVKEGYSLYCLDPTTLAKSGNSISEAVSKCDQGYHNDACMGTWQKTAPGVVAQELNIDVDAGADSTSAGAFCYGGTSMYMDGFHWTNPTCVIYLFPAWVLSTSQSLIGACFGTIFFGIALEGVILQRRRTVKSFPENSWKRNAVSTFLYGVQLTMGYFIMLVVMTYSGPLFMSVVFGLMIGHFVCNSKLCHAKQQSSNVLSGVVKSVGNDDERGSDCCSTAKAGECCTCPRESRVVSDPFVPEGSTPCCQNEI